MLSKIASSVPIRMTNDFSWMFNPDGGNHAFDPIIQAIKDTGIALYMVIFTVGIVALVISIAVIIIQVGFGGQQKREIGKDKAFWAIICGVALFSISAIVGSLASIGMSLNEQIMEQMQQQENTTTESESTSGFVNTNDAEFVAELGDGLIVSIDA